MAIAATAAALALGACSKEADDSDLANLANEIGGNETDPALTSALQDQLMVDPTLSQQSNRNALRPPETPTQAQYPGGQGADMLRGSLADGAACGNNFDYAAHWAERLPAGFAIYPNGRVTEAAANNSGKCRIRVVTFVTDAAPNTVIQWYQSLGTHAGYSAERQQRGADLVLAGSNARSGTGYFVIATPRGSGSDIALIINDGR
jgi:hypothetical protein